MALEHDLDTPLARAVRAAKSQSAFGRLIGRSQSYVHGLLRDGKQLQPKEALKVDDAGYGSRFDLCPEIFRRETVSEKPIADPRFEHAS